MGAILSGPAHSAVQRLCQYEIRDFPGFPETPQRPTGNKCRAKCVALRICKPNFDRALTMRT
jgi:hypothetical protein